jgi:hypothetical protein
MRFRGQPGFGDRFCFSLGRIEDMCVSSGPGVVIWVVYFIPTRSCHLDRRERSYKDFSFEDSLDMTGRILF